MFVPTRWWETMPGHVARTPSVFLETACHSSLARVCSEQQDVSRLFERSAGFEAWRESLSSRAGFTVEGS
jgi:hypothetical protein